MSTNFQNALDICARARKIGIPLVGESEQFLRLLQIVERAARHGSATVLIRGETGTGKELIARATHYLGPRSAFPFVPVNCGALPETLVENELFGHRSGAFTSAANDTAGLVRLAHRGTLFLDEVDSLPAKAQVGLLRFLQDGHFRPLGAPREERSDVRIIAASNGCLEDEVSANRFRQDLYYRLNLLAIDVPPLRTRRGDVRLLSQHFLREYAQRYSMPPKSLHGETMQWFDGYGWPGNVRELENLLHREWLLSEDDELRIPAPDAAKDKATVSICSALKSDAALAPYRLAKARALEEFDRAYLSGLLRRTHGNVSKAAQLAGKERRAFGKLLKRYRISRRVEGCDGSAFE